MAKVRGDIGSYIDNKKPLIKAANIKPLML